jgi:uncharacterized protein
MRIINCPMEVKELSDNGSFEGLASVYGGKPDLGGDIVQAGAFKEFKLTKEGYIRILDSHNTRMPIGKGLLTDTHVGLAIKGKLNLGVSYARNVYELMKDGIIEGLSIGYDVNPGGSETKDGTRYLKDLTLWEVSTTAFPMCESALIGSVKSVPQFETIRECESWLRDEVGLTNSAAKDFVVRFKKALVRDEPPRDEASAKAVLDYLSTLKFT